VKFFASNQAWFGIDPSSQGREACRLHDKHHEVKCRFSKGSPAQPLHAGRKPHQNLDKKDQPCDKGDDTELNDQKRLVMIV